MQDEVLGGISGDNSMEVPSAAYIGRSLRKLNVTQRLEQKKAELERELAVVNKALDSLKADPNLEGVINAIQQAL